MGLVVVSEQTPKGVELSAVEGDALGLTLRQWRLLYEHGVRVYVEGLAMGSTWHLARVQMEPWQPPRADDDGPSRDGLF